MRLSPYRRKRTREDCKRRMRRILSPAYLEKVVADSNLSGKSSCRTSWRRLETSWRRIGQSWCPAPDFGRTPPTHVGCLGKAEAVLWRPGVVLGGRGAVLERSGRRLGVP